MGSVTMTAGHNLRSKWHRGSASHPHPDPGPQCLLLACVEYTQNSVSSSVMLSCSRGVGLVSTVPMAELPEAQRGRGGLPVPPPPRATTPLAAGASLQEAHSKDALPPRGAHERYVGGVGGSLESNVTAPDALTMRTEWELDEKLAPRYCSRVGHALEQ
jgi:hypothetical protein